MDKQKQIDKDINVRSKKIEEMAKDLHSTHAVSAMCSGKDCNHCKHATLKRFDDYTCIDLDLAENLYNAGYRKIPENAVVILDEEMEEFAEKLAKSPQMQKVMNGLIKAWKKETAEKFASSIEDILQEPYKGKTEKQMWQRKGMEEGLRMALEICKEISEGKA